jgi:transposase
VRGEIDPQASMFSYIDLESRIPQSHPIRKVRQVVDAALSEIEGQVDEMHAAGGRPSIPPEMLIRASLLQTLFTIRWERQLCERIDYDLMFRWFVGLGMDDPVWNHSKFTATMIFAEEGAKIGVPARSISIKTERLWACGSPLSQSQIQAFSTGG